MAGTPSVLVDKNIGEDAYWGSNSEIFYHKSGNRNFYIFNLVTQESKLIVSNDSVGWMFRPRLSPDNLNVAIFWNRKPQQEAMGLWLISRKDSSQKLLLKGIIVPLKWSSDSKWIYSINSAKTPLEILMVNAINGLTKVIYTFPLDKYWRRRYHSGWKNNCLCDSRNQFRCMDDRKF